MSRNNFIQNLQNNGEYSYRIRKRSQKHKLKLDPELTATWPPLPLFSHYKPVGESDACCVSSRPVALLRADKPTRIRAGKYTKTKKKKKK